MELNDLHRLIVVQNQVKEEATRNYRVYLDKVFIGELEGEGYLSCNMISGRHTIELFEGRFSVCSKGFVVRETQHITRAFVRTMYAGKASIMIDNGVSDEPVRPEGTQHAGEDERGMLLSYTPQTSGQQNRRRRGSVFGQILSLLVAYAMGLITAWIYFSFFS